MTLSASCCNTSFSENTFAYNTLTSDGSSFIHSNPWTRIFIGLPPVIGLGKMNYIELTVLYILIHQWMGFSNSMIGFNNYSMTDSLHSSSILIAFCLSWLSASTRIQNVRWNFFGSWNKPSSTPRSLPHLSKTSAY